MDCDFITFEKKGGRKTELSDLKNTKQNKTTTDNNKKLKNIMAKVF